MKKANFIILALALFILSACSKETGYVFTIENTTDYTINRINVGGTKQSTFSIPPNEISEPFVAIRISNFATFFSEPLMTITVLEYSDSISSYQNNIGEVLSFDKFSTKEVNRISLKLDENNYHETKKFTIYDKSK